PAGGRLFFFLMIRRPPRSTQGVSSAASDVYKRQFFNCSWITIILSTKLGIIWFNTFHNVK
ncbi:hypothetical protein, partial [Staphylococcus aureus]